MVRRLYKMYDQDIDECYKNIMELKAATKQDPKDKKIEDKFYREFGERVRQLRMKNNMTQAELGKKCGWKDKIGAQMFICDIENSKRRGIAVHKLSALINVLDTTFDYLVYGKE